MSAPQFVRFKEWVFDQAPREGRNAKAVYARFYRGKYPGLHRRPLNQRVILVRAASNPVP